MDKNEEMEVWGQCIELDLSGDDLHGFLMEKCGTQNESYQNIMELMGYDSGETLTPPEENFIATIVSEEQAVETETRIEGFEIIEEVGRGGMGVILKAYDLDMRRTVAVKVLREKHRHNLYVINRFSIEPRIAGHISHMGIPPVYSHGLTDDGRPYFAMKLIEGQTLSEIMKDDCCKADSRILGIFRSVCATMAYAHECGIVNLDLKPQNVMVGKFGEVQVTDWGISARFKEKEHPFSQDAENIDNDQVVGTVGIMPPEQVRGDRDLLRSPTCDVYSLGVMLGQIITDNRRATDASLRDSLLANCEASETLVDASMKCIQKEQGDRYGDASELLEVIDDYMETQRARRKDAEVKLAAEEKAFVKLWSAFLVVLVALVVSVWACFAVHKATSSLRMANKGLTEANVLKDETNQRLEDALHSSNSMVAAELLSHPFVSRKMIVKMSDGVYDGSLAKRVLMSKLNRGVISREPTDPVEVNPTYETIKGTKYLSATNGNGSDFLVSPEGGYVGLREGDEEALFFNCGYFGVASCVSFEGDYVCVGTREGNVVVFEIDSGEAVLKKVVRAHSASIDSVSIDGETVTTKADSYEVKSSITKDFYEESIASNGSTHSTSSNGMYTVVVNSDGFVRLFDNESMGRLKWREHSIMNAKWAVSNDGEKVVGVSDHWLTVISNGSMKRLEQVDLGSVRSVVIDNANNNFSVKRKTQSNTIAKGWEITLHDMDSIRSEVIYSGHKQAWVHFSNSGESYIATSSGEIYSRNNPSENLFEHEHNIKSSSSNELGFVVADSKGVVTQYRYSFGRLIKVRSIETGNEQITDIAVSMGNSSAMIITTKSAGTWVYSMITGGRIASMQFDCDKASFGYRNNTVYTQAKTIENKDSTGVTRWTIE